MLVGVHTTTKDSSMSMTRGLIAGAAGTVALNGLTYLDMAARGRPSSSVPAQTVAGVTETADLADDDETGRNRRQGFGSLLGYVTGLGFGAIYGTVAGRARPSVATGGAALAVGAMAAANGPSVAMGVTDPREWGAEGWIADVVPHLAYGFVTAAVFDAITGEQAASGAGASGR